MRVVAAVGLVVLLILGGPTELAIATNSEGGPNPLYGEQTSMPTTDHPIDVTYAIERMAASPGKVRVTARYDLPARVSQVTVGTGQQNLTVVSAEGFTERPNGDYIISGSTQAAELTYVVDVNETHRRFGSQAEVDTGDWALFETTDVALYHSWRFTGSSVDLHDTYRIADGDQGYVDEYVFLGPHETETIGTETGAVTVVVPAAADEAPSAAEITRPLGAASRSFDVASQESNITLFVAPDVVRRGGESAGGAMWVSEDVPTNASDNVWAHEYVHEQQHWNATEETRWTIEGTASYYDHVVPLREGWADYDEFRSGFDDTTYADDDLSAPDNWSSVRTPYKGGGRAVALIDARIKRETSGTESFQSVVYLMNRHDGPITQRDFFDIVERVVGHSLDEYLGSVIESRAGRTVPDDPSLYTVS